MPLWRLLARSPDPPSVLAQRLGAHVGQADWNGLTRPGVEFAGGIDRDGFRGRLANTPGPEPKVYLRFVSDDAGSEVRGWSVLPPALGLVALSMMALLAFLGLAADIPGPNQRLAFAGLWLLPAALSLGIFIARTRQTWSLLCRRLQIPSSGWMSSAPPEPPGASEF